MELFEDIKDFRTRLDQERKHNKKIGFIPTMGALHLGHTSLVDRSVRENNLTIASIFVNPSQFNDPNDLSNYPRTPDADYKLLSEHGCNIIFCPTAEQMYPGKMQLIDLELGSLAKVMEGKFRPGHFQGMATIVFKLLSLVQPSSGYFGEKDFQQLAIIRYMVNKLQMPVQVIGCETIREPDGLAMSSRNIHLSKEERNQASIIYKSMQSYCALTHTLTPEMMKVKVISAIENTGLFNVEYFEIVNAHTLQSIENWQQADEIRACIAVKSSKTRLIDNIEVKL